VPSYRDEADDLDREIFATIRAWSDAAFNYLSLKIFEHQLRYNEPYARYCAARGVTPDTMPEDWERIIPAPASAFKDARLATFASSPTQISFETSGTTRGESGTHYMDNATLYDASLLSGFKHFMLADGKRLHFVNLVTNPVENPHTSLGYMMQVAAEKYGRSVQWFMRNGVLDVSGFVRTVTPMIDRGEPVCIATTAFALVHLLDALEGSGINYNLPPGSRIMETGGFKGRSRIVERTELYTRATTCFGLPPERIIAEYGMTELTSQYYDDVRFGAQFEVRGKIGPPWLRARVVGPDGFTLPNGTVGALVHVDLANRSSCVAIETEDLGVRYGDHFVLLGRETGAKLRGCSLSAEELLAQ
jgi:hypothetical protein